jgi:hypothetical protein
MNALHITRYCCRRVLMTRVDLLEKILCSGLENGAEGRAGGWAWWVDYGETKERGRGFEWLVSEKRARGSLGEGGEAGR